jgi:hypothetical protein
LQREIYVHTLTLVHRSIEAGLAAFDILAFNCLLLLFYSHFLTLVVVVPSIWNMCMRPRCAGHRKGLGLRQRR